MNETMTTLEIVKIFNVSVTTIWNWRRSGKLRSYKQGRHRVFLKKDIDQLQIKETQLRLDIKPHERTVIEQKFFNQLSAQISEKEKEDFMSSHVPEDEYCKIVLTLAKKYNISVPKWFRKKCKYLNVAA